MKKNTHGGKRYGAGRKPVKNPTTVVSFRVPVNLAPQIKIDVYKFINQLKKQNERK